MIPLVIVGIAAALIVLVLIWFIATKNSFNRMQVKIKEAESGIDVALTKRYDTLTKLLDCTRAYMKYEEDLQVRLTELRGLPLAEKAALAEKIDGAIRTVNLRAEGYADLKASETYRTLMMAAADSEEHLSASRRAYNANVSAFNRKRVSFPASLIGAGYPEAAFFEADAARREDVKMEF